MSKRTSPLFGPGGNAEAFYEAGYKSTLYAPMWVASEGLTAYEFEAGRGIGASGDALTAIGAAARQAGISMSFHAPYFISLSGVNPETRLKSIDYIENSLWAADLLGAGVIVVHSGSCAKITREEGMRLSSDTLYKALERVGYPQVKIGIETMGKKNQLGTLEEVISLCEMDSRLVPVVDFGHLNARDLGGVFRTSDDFRRVFDAIGSRLGQEVAANLHCHFSKIEWTDAGEKKHLTFDDRLYGPDFEPLMDAIYREGLTPTLICESAGTQARDAKQMMEYYEGLKK